MIFPQRCPVFLLTWLLLTKAMRSRQKRTMPGKKFSSNVSNGFFKRGHLFMSQTSWIYCKFTKPKMASYCLIEIFMLLHHSPCAFSSLTTLIWFLRPNLWGKFNWQTGLICKEHTSGSVESFLGLDSFKDKEETSSSKSIWGVGPLLMKDGSLLRQKLKLSQMCTLIKN